MSDLNAFNSVELGVFASRIESICEEMGAQLRRSAFSPNIRDRLDYSCAIFDATGGLCAQAAHIPVHLGSMAYAMKDVVGRFDWRDGDQVILNDPFLGGTHLPDVTLIQPVFVAQALVGFVANRAHYADIGAVSPGSMPLSRSIEEEGLLIPPQRIARQGRVDRAAVARIVSATRNAVDAAGDLQAQMACNRRGVERLTQLVESLGQDGYTAALAALNRYAEKLARSVLRRLKPGSHVFRDVMESDGIGRDPAIIEVRLRLSAGLLEVDFSGSSGQVAGNINAPLPVTVAAVWYVFRCLMPAQAPACEGCFRPLRVIAPEGSLLNARSPAAVAAGNVETSSRVVDVMLGALAQALPDEIPAASQGTMNNFAFGSDGDQPWGYYETLGGGMGAGARHAGLSCVQSHMTNTRNTPVEVLEMRYPVRIERYAQRRGSGGAGKHRGGDGLIREYRFTEAAQATLLTERREVRPWGLAGGGAGQAGLNLLNGRPLAAKCQIDLHPGDKVTIETPGGGGWGVAS